MQKGATGPMAPDPEPVLPGAVTFARLPRAMQPSVTAVKGLRTRPRQT